MTNTNKFTFLSSLFILFGCGSESLLEETGHASTLWYTQTPEWALDIPVPGQEGRIDGSVWNDGLFRTEEARQEFCDEWKDTPEAWFCSEVGQLEQAWKSSEHHGMATDGSTCYGPSSGSGTNDCIFPEMKHIRIIMTGTACYDGPTFPDGPTLLQEDAILFGIKEGVLAWDNLGAGSGTASDIVANGTPGTDWYSPLKITCNNDDPNSLAVGGLKGNVKKRVDNMPVGPTSGKDPDDAYVIKDLWIDVNIALIWETAKYACGYDNLHGRLEFMRPVTHWDLGTS
jgi:hypothetical protein